MDAQSLEVIQEIAVKDIVEIDFSPKGTFLSTWMRQSKQTHKGKQEYSNHQEGRSVDYAMGSMDPTPVHSKERGLVKNNRELIPFLYDLVFIS
jgi:hypothetical protein